MSAIDPALLRQALEDAWSWRDQLVNGYWCDCDSASHRCDGCQADADMMAAYQQALDSLDASTQPVTA